VIPPLVLAAEDILEHLTDSYEIHFGGRTLDLRPLNHYLKGTFGEWFPGLSKHVVLMMVAALVVGVSAIWCARRAIRDQGRGLFANMVESTALFLRDEVIRPGIGAKHASRFFPYLATLFFFILACNLLGLLPQPFGATATGNVNVNGALAILTLLSMWGAGMAEKGPVGYWLGLVPHGVPWWMWPLVWFIEFFGLFVKPFALTVRLFANMTGGHAVLAVVGGFLLAGGASLGGWLGLKLSVGVPSVAFSVFIMSVELIIAFIQAYIFTILTSIFIGMSLSHEH
jgi:F-type H+-transporting ATPase subunit a